MRSEIEGPKTGAQTHTTTNNQEPSSPTNQQTNKPIDQTIVQTLTQNNKQSKTFNEHHIKTRSGIVNQYSQKTLDPKSVPQALLGVSEVHLGTDVAPKDNQDPWGAINGPPRASLVPHLEAKLGQDGIKVDHSITQN